MGGTRGSAGESRGEILRGPDDSHDEHLDDVDEQFDDDDDEVEDINDDSHL